MSEAAENERDLLAAEYALGVLEGSDFQQAANLAERERAFADLVSQWQERLAPLLDEVEPVEPGAALWERINSNLDGSGGRESNVVELNRRIKRLRTYSAAISAVAASLLLVLAFDPFGSKPVAQPPAQQQRGPMLVANVAAEDRSAAFVVAYDPSDSTLLVSPAVATPAPGHDHELWLIPASGTPLSLGLVASTSPHRLPVRSQVGTGFRRGATIAISVEPVGGSPTGQPTGPVVATGKLSSI